MVFKNRFTCESCGAAMSYDASLQALRCPFCDSQRLIAQPDATTLTPKFVVPFKVSRQQALQILYRQMRSTFFQPSDLVRQADITQMTAVYVPFWTFSAQVHTYWTADTSDVPPFASGNWRPIFGEIEDRLEGILVPASKVLAYDEIEGLGSYDLSQGVPPESVDLDNVVVEQFSRPKKYARQHAREAVEKRQQSYCATHLIPGDCRNVHVNVKITQMSGEPVLLPVWILAYRYRGRVYRYVINGQSGRPHGSLPVSFWKVVSTVVVLALAVIFMIVIIGAIIQ